MIMIYKLSACLVSTLLLTAAPLAAEDLMSNPNVIAACAAKGAVPASVKRVSNTSVSVTCAKAQTSAPLTEGTTAASAAPALLLPALLLAMLGGSSSSGTN